MVQFTTGKASIFQRQHYAHFQLLGLDSQQTSSSSGCKVLNYLLDVHHIYFGQFLIE